MYDLLLRYIDCLRQLKSIAETNLEPLEPLIENKEVVSGQLDNALTAIVEIGGKHLGTDVLHVVAEIYKIRSSIKNDE